MITCQMETVHFPLERRQRQLGDGSTEDAKAELGSIGRRSIAAWLDVRGVFFCHGEKLIDGDGHTLGGEEAQKLIQCQNAQRV